MIAFETGRIRPPSEAQSVLLRLTRGCPWNRCAFCPVYKRERFSVRTVEELKRDIDAMAVVAQRLGRRMGLPFGAAAGGAVVAAALDSLDGEEIDGTCAQQMAFWMFHGLRSLFLQDADSLVLRTADVVEILNHVRAAFPTIARITSYARAKTLSHKSLEELQALRAAGLNRIHVGLESGSDAVLSFMHKGVTQDEQIRAGRNVVAAGIELSEYFMPGLGGQELAAEHVAQSAAALSAINPTFIRIRTTVPVPGTPLYDITADGRWSPRTEEEKVGELRAFLEGLQGVTSMVQSDHIMNLLEEIAGRLPDDKPQMLAVIDRFLGLSPDERESYIVGRRIGRYRYLSDFVPSPEVEQVRRELIRRFGSLERGVREIVATYI